MFTRTQTAGSECSETRRRLGSFGRKKVPPTLPAAASILSESQFSSNESLGSIIGECYTKGLCEHN
jgi:hypothetical protein